MRWTNPSHPVTLERLSLICALPLSSFWLVLCCPVPSCPGPKVGDKPHLNAAAKAKIRGPNMLSHSFGSVRRGEALLEFSCKKSQGYRYRSGDTAEIVATAGRCDILVETHLTVAFGIWSVEVEGKMYQNWFPLFAFCAVSRCIWSHRHNIPTWWKGSCNLTPSACQTLPLRKLRDNKSEIDLQWKDLVEIPRPLKLPSWS